MSTPVTSAEKFHMVIEYDFIAPGARYTDGPDAYEIGQLRNLAHAALSNLHTGCWVNKPQVTIVKVGEL